MKEISGYKIIEKIKEKKYLTTYRGLDKNNESSIIMIELNGILIYMLLHSMF